MDVRFTVQDAVVFCEDVLEGQVITEIKEIGATQNTTLLDIKKKMAAKAKALGGNAIINFKYSLINKIIFKVTNIYQIVSTKVKVILKAT
jgi:uncharacterized protein YbjQ (UPF0145 family)